MLKAKYIKDKMNGIVIFPAYMQHSAFSHLEPVSAGFIECYNNEAFCYGESISLNLKADENDSAIATRQLFGTI